MMCRTAVVLMLNELVVGFSDSALEIPKSQLKFGKELTSGKYGVSKVVAFVCMWYYVHKLQQYMMSGWWKGKEVAVRVANDNALTDDGLQFIEEAVTAMKYVLMCDCNCC